MPKTWSRLLHLAEDTLLVVLMGAMVLVSFVQIALRNLFTLSLEWADPLVQLLLLWTAFLGALVATRRQAHIHIDALLRLIPPRCRRGLQVAGAAFSALVCLFLSGVAVRFLLGERDAGSTGIWSLPTWQLQLIFPLTFGLMALRFAAQAADHLRQSTPAAP